MYHLDNCCLRSSSIDIKIINGLNRLTINQHYCIEGNSALEVYYKFPVPANYSVTCFKINIGDNVIHSILKEKSTAISDYNYAISEGNRGFLLQTCNNEQLECCLGNVAPGTNILVTIILSGELKCEINSNTYRLIIPTTFANKYSPNDIHVVDNDKVKHDDITYSMNINLEIRMNGGIKTIKYNNSILYPASDQFQFNIEPDNLDRDIVVVIERNISSSYAVTNNNKELVKSKFKYATQLNIIPEHSSLSKVPESEIHYCLILDRSGSMSNDTEVLKEAAKMAMNILPYDCYVDIYAFSNGFEKFSCDIQTNTTEYRSKLFEWIENIKCYGGTEIMPVLKDAYYQIENSGKMGSIIFLSDGEVRNTNEIINLIKEHPTIRVFTLGIGTCVSEKLINDMAEAGKGISEFAKNVKDTLESKVASVVLRAQTSLSSQNKYKLNIESTGLYEIIPKILPPLMENYNNMFYIFSETPITSIAVNNNIIIIDQNNDDYTIINSIAALRYMKYLECNLGKISKISHIKQFYHDEYKKSVIECSISNNVLSEFTSYVAVQQLKDKNNETLELVEIPLQHPNRSYNMPTYQNHSVNDLSGLFNLANSMMEKMGHCPPTRITRPDDYEISSVINEIFCNNSTQSAIQDICKSLQISQESGLILTDQINIDTTLKQTQTICEKDIIPVAFIDPMKIKYITRDNILISINPENLSLLCENISSLSSLQLSCGNIVELIGIGKFKVILVGSDTEKWILKFLKKDNK